jgi:DNA-binding CsgD family transcriptional regulator
METIEIKLTENQRLILIWLSKGKSGEEIAQLVGITTGAVYMNMLRLKNKLGASTNAGLVGLALRSGIIE